jgi:hypothetical protein
MAVRCVLDRIFGIRVRLKWDCRKCEVWFVVDEDDLKAVSILEVLKYSAAVDAWSRDFLSRHPGWKIDGQSTPNGDEDDDEQTDEQDDDETDVKSQLALPVQERSQDQEVLSESLGDSLPDSELLDFFGSGLA